MPLFKPEESSLKTDGNQLYLRRLFLETSYQQNDRSGIPYTLSDQDHPEGYKSLYKLYMDFEDPTEFSFANQFLLGHDHWTRLCETSWFKPYAERWRHELELKLKHKALEIVKNVAHDDGHKDQFQAVKILLNAGWKDKEAPQRSKRGRPSKAEVKGALKERLEEDKELLKELERVKSYAN